MGYAGRHKLRRKAEIRDLEEIATQLDALKGEADSWLTGPSYDMVKFRLEEAHSAVEVAATEARHTIREHKGDPSTEKAKEMVGAR
jgi:hypothetical protein